MAALSIQQRLSASVAVSTSGTYTNDFQITNHKFVSCHIVKTGAGTGTAKLQHSNDGTNWVDVNTTTFPNATGAVSAGAASTYLTCDTAAHWVRVTFTEAGTNSVTISAVTWNAKLH